MTSFVKRLAEYALHNAPKGIAYHKIANGSSIEGSTEVDVVPVPKGEEIPGHIHEYSSALIFVLSGKGTVTLDDEQKEIRKYDVVNIPAGTYHDFQASLDEQLTFISVQNPPINGDYVFEKTAPKRILPFFNKVLPWAVTASLTASILGNVGLNYMNSNLERENSELFDKNIEYSSASLEQSMEQYHGQLREVTEELGISFEELRRQGPYPLI